MTKKKTNGDAVSSENSETELNINNIDKVTADGVGDDKIEKKQEEISELDAIKMELAEQKSIYLRLLADFDNFRKRMTEQSLRQRQDGIAYAIEVIFPVLDSIDRAASCVDEASREGIELIKKQFETALKTLGIEEIGENNVPFDPNIHHAVMRVEEEENTGLVTEVFQKGYKFKDRVIRCAMVKVAE